MRPDRHRSPMEYELASAVVVRTPSLPCDAFAALADDAEAPRATPEARAAAVAGDERRIRERLRAWLATPIVREALHLASPGLLRALERPHHPGDAPLEDAEGAFFRYLARMMLRATPFGLFAGVTAVPLADAGCLVLGDVAAGRRVTRIDNELLAAVVDAHAATSARRPEAMLRTNGSLYRLGHELRYAEQGWRDGRRASELVRSRLTPHLARAVELAQPGIPRARLVDTLAAELPRVARHAIEAFVDQLVQAQLLEHDLAVEVTGKDPLAAVLAVLPATAPLGAQLRCVGEQLARIDAAGPGADPSSYDAPLAILSALAPDVAHGKQLQVDLARPAGDARVPTELARELVRGAEILAGLAPAPAHAALERFRADFLDRYGDGTAPLVEVLDEESGIGFESTDASRAANSPLLRGVAPARRKQAGKMTCHDGHGHLLRRLAGARLAELELDGADLEALRRPEARLPSAFAVVGTIVDGSDARRRLHVSAFAGPSGARLLGRFCNLDADIERLVREHVGAEERLAPDAIFAEIVHLPEGRVGNIICRPSLRAHEIPFLGRSGAPAERQIGVTDLLVRVVGERVVLWSASRDREVVPRLSTAHNYAGYGIATYRFLASLQDQEVTSIGRWSWGPLEHLAYLPRVRHDRWVFQAARWSLLAPQLAPLAAAARGDGGLRRARVWDAMQRLRDTLELPRLVVLVDGDHRLPIDLDNVVSVDATAQLLKTRSHAVLEELYPRPEQACVTSGGQRHAHELVVLAHRRLPVAPVRLVRPASSGVSAAPDVRKSFAPGSDWLYARIDAGPATVDRLLVDDVAPLLAWLRRRGVIDRWFFVRYDTPRWHLRLRLHGDAARLAAEALPALHDALAPACEARLAGPLRLDTYDRELHRYGGDQAIEAAEAVFCADSDAVLATLTALGGGDDDRRWLATAAGLDRMLADLGHDVPARLRVVDALRDGFARELGVDSGVRRRIGERFRGHREALEAVLAERPATGGWLEGVRAAWDQRGTALRALATLARGLEARGALTTSWFELTASLTHMHVNRLARAGLRQQEAILYELLSRAYRSRIGRASADAGAELVRAAVGSG